MLAWIPGFLGFPRIWAKKAGVDRQYSSVGSSVTSSAGRTKYICHTKASPPCAGVKPWCLSLGRRLLGVRVLGLHLQLRAPAQDVMPA